MSNRTGAKLLAAAGAIALLFVAAAGFVIVERRAEEHALAADTEARAMVTVSVIHPAQEQADEDLVLPATLQAFVDSPVYARTSGYVKKWYKDIGAQVASGDLLAEIDTPEV